MSKSNLGSERTDDELFVQIRDMILRHPAAFREAGQWLDNEYFDVKAFESKQPKKSRKQKNIDPAQAGKPQKAKRRQPSDNQDWLAYTHRFQAAVQFYVKRDHDGDAAHPTRHDAERCLLMAWLMTDPEADQRGLGLTKFEGWPWEPVDPSGDRFGFGRKFFSDNKLRWWTELNNRSQQWIDLCRRCFRRLSNLLPTKEPDVSILTHGSAGSATSLGHSIPPEDRIALLKHADALDAYAQRCAREAQRWLDQETDSKIDVNEPFWDLHLKTHAEAFDAWKESWAAKNTGPDPHLGVKHLYLMLGLEGSNAVGAVWMNASQTDALHEIRESARRLSVYAPHINQDVRLLPNRDDTDLSIAAGLRNWLMCVLGNEAHLLNAYLKHFADDPNEIIDSRRIRPELAKRLPIDPVLSAAIDAERQSLGLSKGAPRIEINEYTREISVDGEVIRVQARSAFKWLVDVIRGNGALVPAPATQRRFDLVKKLHPTLKNLLGNPVSGPNGGTALKLEWRK